MFILNLSLFFHESNSHGPFTLVTDASGISSIFSMAFIKASPPRALATRKSCATCAVAVLAFS